MKQASIPHNNCRKTIRGMVVPAQWNERFQVTGVLVACRDEREVRVENLENFPILRTLEQQEALFTGLVRENDGGESIFIEKIKLINEMGR
ncbi:hypothetical protein [uncultured Pseudodesulfovibrio sp.]|uniref:hypothetical protein n=1 Tax=uncultured Pseudodesulfovibrio sp. TaxID=2035858 RepID=UPI0029C60C1E|nr:hypothetical protein [uncultured Pseudodesulfovibrio sp.]